MDHVIICNGIKHRILKCTILIWIQWLQINIFGILFLYIQCSSLLFYVLGMSKCRYLYLYLYLSIIVHTSFLYIFQSVTIFLSTGDDKGAGMFVVAGTEQLIADIGSKWVDIVNKDTVFQGIRLMNWRWESV